MCIFLWLLNRRMLSNRRIILKRDLCSQSSEPPDVLFEIILRGELHCIQPEGVVLVNPLQTIHWIQHGKTANRNVKRT